MIYELYHYAVQYNQVTMVSPTVFVNYILYRGVRGRKTKVGRKLSFSSYSIEAPEPGLEPGTL